MPNIHRLSGCTGGASVQSVGGKSTELRASELVWHGTALSTAWTEFFGFIPRVRLGVFVLGQAFLDPSFPGLLQLSFSKVGVDGSHLRDLWQALASSLCT
jgi:hypothetical protein